MGVINADAMLGAVFAMTTVVETAVPLSSPSFGVMRQVTPSPEAKPELKVAPVPTTVPSTNHSKVDKSGSPSESEKPELAHKSVSLADGVAGVIEAV